MHMLCHVNYYDVKNLGPQQTHIHQKVTLLQVRQH